MKLVFGIMSAVQSVETVRQLAAVLAPHRVVIHHDFSQVAEFVVDQPHVTFVSDPKRTGWAVWGFTDGVFHLMRHCVEREDCDYFQLLSPTCLPIRPLSEFSQMVATSDADAHIDFLDMDEDDDALMNFGYRAFAPAASLRFRVLQRCLLHYYGYEWQSERRANLQLRTAPAGSRGGAAALCRTATRVARRGWLGRHPYVSRLRPLAGGSWFGARRHACEAMLRMFDDPGITDWFKKVHIADEFLVATLLGNAGLRLGPSNHLVNEFTAGNPNWLNLNDMQMLKGCGRYFARKFPDDPEAPVRKAMLAHVSRGRPADEAVAAPVAKAGGSAGVAMTSETRQD